MQTIMGVSGQESAELGLATSEILRLNPWEVSLVKESDQGAHQMAKLASPKTLCLGIVIAIRL